MVLAATRTVFMVDGRVGIDNNPVENAIRPTAVGKKNWQFFGKAEAGQRAAILYTFIESCRTTAFILSLGCGASSPACIHGLSDGSPNSPSPPAPKLHAHPLVRPPPPDHPSAVNSNPTASCAPLTDEVSDADGWVKRAGDPTPVVRKANAKQRPLLVDAVVGVPARTVMTW